jgi:hypothetical protein
MARGKLDSPMLDDRTWQDLVNQATALIPHYAEEWTDHNPSDLGMTLIELFAWLVEQMIYRLNRVPEKNYIAFLNLLGITRDPATPATTWVTFKIGGDAPVTVPAGSQVSTQPTASEEGLIFETDEDVTIAPANLVAAFCSDTSGGIESAPLSLSGVTLAPPPNNGTARIILGFEGRWGDEISLLARLSRPLPPDSKAPAWQYYTTTGWKSFKASDQTFGLARNGRVGLALPADWLPQKLPEADGKERFWAQVVVTNPGRAGWSWDWNTCCSTAFPPPMP